jgi:hypothetical protein
MLTTKFFIPIPMQPENRRSFVKKSVATTISLSSATFFSSLIRARGDEGGGGGETTSDPWETTYETTIDPFETTIYYTTAETTATTGQTTHEPSPGVKRTAPLSIVDVPDSVDLQINGATVAVLRASVESDQATSNEPCRLEDFVTYLCTAELCAPGSTTPLAVGGSILISRHFSAKRSGSAGISFERTGNNGYVPINAGAASSGDDSKYDVTYGGQDDKLFVETERLAVGGDTVTVRVRGLIKIKNGNDYNFHSATDWVTRTTTWVTCEDA